MSYEKHVDTSELRLFSREVAIVSLLSLVVMTVRVMRGSATELR